MMLRVPSSRLVTKAKRLSLLKAISWWPLPVARCLRILRLAVSITVTPESSADGALLPTHSRRSSGCKATRTGLAACGHRVEQLELLTVDHRDFARRGHRHEHPLVVPGGDPIHRWLLDIDAGHGAGDAAHRDRGVDHRDAGITVHHHQEVAVEVEQRPCADTRFKEHPDPRLAACSRPWAWSAATVSGSIQAPGATPASGWPDALSVTLKRTSANPPSRNTPSCSQRPHLEGHRHPVTFKRSGRSR